MTPLSAHKKDLIVLDNIDMVAASRSTGDAHGVGMGCMLTGKKLQQSGEQFVAGMGGPGSGWPDNISIDQLIAQTVGAKTTLGSLELAGKRFAGNLWSRMSYKGPANPVLAPEEDPQRAFDRVFGAPNQNAEALKRLATRRRSVLDNALSELNTLSAKMGATDRQKLLEDPRGDAARFGAADRQHVDDDHDVQAPDPTDRHGEPGGHREPVRDGADQRPERQDVPGHHQGPHGHHGGCARLRHHARRQPHHGSLAQRRRPELGQLWRVGVQGITPRDLSLRNGRKRISEQADDYQPVVRSADLPTSSPSSKPFPKEPGPCSTTPSSCGSTSSGSAIRTPTRASPLCLPGPRADTSRPAATSSFRAARP